MSEDTATWVQAVSECIWDRIVAEQWPVNTCVPSADLAGSVDRDVAEHAQRVRLRGNPLFGDDGGS